MLLVQQFKKNVIFLKNFQRVACGKTIKELIFDWFKIAFNSFNSLVALYSVHFALFTSARSNQILDFLGVKFLVRLNYG